MNVRELIAELIRYDMDEEVFVGLGASANPTGASAVHSARDYSDHSPRGSDGRCPFGVYIIPTLHLEDAN